MNRFVAMASGGIGLALTAAVLAETTFALGSGSNVWQYWQWQGRFGDGWQVLVSPTPRVTPTPVVTTQPTATSTPVVTPVATSTPRPLRTATTNAFVHVRAGASTATAILFDLNGGVTVELLSYQDASWQQVRYNGVTGYIFRSYLTY